jgi:hypothetical protein
VPGVEQPGATRRKEWVLTPTDADGMLEAAVRHTERAARRETGPDAMKRPGHRRTRS